MSSDREGGQTLVEMSIACAIMVVIFGAGLSLSVESRDAWTHLYGDTGAQYAGREALKAIALELSTSNPTQVTITAGTDFDTLTFLEPVSLSGDAITWGADGTAAHKIRISVIQGRLVRQVLNGTFVVGRDRVLAPNVDSLRNGQKGFAVARTNSLVTLSLRTRASATGQVWRKQESTGVLLRN